MRNAANMTRRFSLRTLRDEIDYESALEVAKTLVGRVDPIAEQVDYLNALTDIIQKYESRHHAVHEHPSVETEKNARRDST